MGLTYSELLEHLRSRCNGKHNACYAEDILIALTGSCNEPLRRKLRFMVRDLRERGFPIVIPRDSQGYYWANQPDDLGDFLGLMRAKAFSSLKLVAKMLRLSMPDLQGQLRIRDIDSEPTPILDDPEPLDLERTVSCAVDLPTDLYLEFRNFLENHAQWDFNSALTNALAMFLLQNGIRSRVASRAYLAHLAQENQNGQKC